MVVVVVLVVVVVVVVEVTVVGCLSDTLLNHHTRTRNEVLTAVISVASILQRC